jgi:hypothetical protein
VLTTPRTVGGSLLRQALDEVNAQVKAQAAAGDATTRQLTAFAAYDPATGAQLGVAVLWHGAKGSEWVLSGALSRTVQASPSPYGVRLELQGRF